MTVSASNHSKAIIEAFMELVYSREKHQDPNVEMESVSSSIRCIDSYLGVNIKRKLCEPDLNGLSGAYVFHLAPKNKSQNSHIFNRPSREDGLDVYMAKVSMDVFTCDESNKSYLVEIFHCQPVVPLLFHILDYDNDGKIIDKIIDDANVAIEKLCMRAKSTSAEECRRYLIDQGITRPDRFMFDYLNPVKHYSYALATQILFFYLLVESEDK